MQADNSGKAPGTTTQGTRRKLRARMALTLSGLLIAGGTVLLGQLGNAQSDRFGDTSSSSQPDVRIGRCAATTRSTSMGRSWPAPIGCCFAD